MGVASSSSYFDSARAECNKLERFSDLCCEDKVHSSFVRTLQLEPRSKREDTLMQDWRWLALQCERRLSQQSFIKSNQRRSPDLITRRRDIDQFACFVPRTVIEAIADRRIRNSSTFDVIIEEFYAAVVFCDASGFTALSEALDTKPDGAEKLGECINSFFGPLIQIVSYWGGDIIKFSGDALTIVWPVDDDLINYSTDQDFQKIKYKKTQRRRKRINDAGNPSLEATYRVDGKQACRLACQCCLDLHFNLNMFPTPEEGKFLSLHIGVGYGHVTVLQVGGVLDRWEYVVAGPPLQEIAIAEPLANSGETVLSPTVLCSLGDENYFELVPISVKAAESGIKSGKGCLSREGYVKLIGLRGKEIPPPPPLASAPFDDTDISLLKRFIPTAVFKRLTARHNVFLNELRRVSVVFVGIHDLDVSTNSGSQTAQRLMEITQKAAYTMEGSVNKFLVDDKGVLILVMFGLPPVYHVDDSLRALLAALRIVDGLRSLGIMAGIGVATGRVWCGTIGCWLRKEYTAIGDVVNLSARLMGLARKNEINCDLETKSSSDHIMEFRVLPPVHMKGKQYLVPLFQPTGRMHRHAVLQTITGEPIGTWSDWKCKKRLHRLLFPGYEYLPPKLSEKKLQLDFPIKCGPLFPWEYVEPWNPELQPTIDLGGVLVLQGKETDGTTELVQYIAESGASLDRFCFVCSNMPDSIYVNIANVPMLPWSKLCTEIIEAWRFSTGRKRKGYASVACGDSVYSLAKELIHPVFHWQFQKLKSLLHGLVLPNEEDNRVSLSNTPTTLNDGSHTTDSCDEIQKFYRFIDPISNEKTNESLAHLICSLVNGFTMYNPCIICLHVRSGTSLFASMDGESWKVARLLSRIAMMRRRRKIELDWKELKNWRRQHSRSCVWCRGTWEPYKRLNRSTVHPQWTSCCKPHPSKYFPPFLFILVCNDSPQHIPEKQEILQYARESNGLINITRLAPLEAASYLAHCLSVTPQGLPDELVEYVYRVSAGIPKYIYLTARQLVTEQAILIKLSRIYKTPSKLMQCLASESQDQSKRREPTQSTTSLQGHTVFSSFRLKSPKLEQRKNKLNFWNTPTQQSFPRAVLRSRPTWNLSYIFKKKWQNQSNQKTPYRRYLKKHQTTPFSCKVANTKGFLWSSRMRSPKFNRKCQKFERNRVLTVKKNVSDRNSTSNDSIRKSHFNAIFQTAANLCSRYGKNKYANSCIMEDIGVGESSLFSLSDNEKKSVSENSIPLRNISLGPDYIPPGPEFFNTRVSSRCCASRIPALFPSSYEKEMEVTSCQTTTNIRKACLLSYQPNLFFTSHPYSTKNTSKLKKVEIIKNLKKVPFVSDLRAAAMSLMERLEPDEQLVAKVASIFPVPFTAFEIQAIYPRTVSSESFQKMLENLIRYEMLERCDPPTETQLEEIDFFPLHLVKQNLKGGSTVSDEKDGIFSECSCDLNSFDQFSTADSIITEGPRLANQWGVDECGNPIFHRFSSIAFQHVVAELIMSRERIFLAQISRKVIFFRRIYGFNFLIKQINAGVSHISYDQTAYENSQ